MIRKLALLFLSFLSVAPSAWAKDGLRTQIFVFNPEIRFERADDQTLSQRQPLNYGVAARLGNYSGLFEISTFKTDSGNVALNISREQQSYMLWGRVHFLNRESLPLQGSLYFAGGLGSYQETIITSLNGVSRNDKSGRQLEGGLGLGSDAIYLINGDVGLIVGAEARLLFGKEFDPNPQFSAVFRIGLQF